MTDAKWGPGTNTGHGHVWERPDRVRARCGGQALCGRCRSDARIVAALLTDSPVCGACGHKQSMHRNGDHDGPCWYPIGAWDGAAIQVCDCRAFVQPEPAASRTDLVALVADLIPKPSGPERVADWPADEQAIYLADPWITNTERNRRLDRFRQEKAARAILAALGMSPDADGPEMVPASWLDEMRRYGNTFRCAPIKAGGVCNGQHITGWGDAMVGISRCEMGHYIVGRIDGMRAGINLPGADDEADE